MTIRDLAIRDFGEFDAFSEDQKLILLALYAAGVTTAGGLTEDQLQTVLENRVYSDELAGLLMESSDACRQFLGCLTLH